MIYSTPTPNAGSSDFLFELPILGDILTTHEGPDTPRDTHLNVLAAIKCNCRSLLAHGTYICPASGGRINRRGPRWPKVGTTTIHTRRIPAGKPASPSFYCNSWKIFDMFINSRMTRILIPSFF